MTPDQITSHRLEDGDVSVTILSLGAITQDWQVPGPDGRRAPRVLGHDRLADYLTYPGHLGTIEGRVANRIGGAGFTLQGRRFDLPANEGPNVLHGGPDGWSRRNWALDPDGTRAVVLSLVSPDGDQGMPGRVDMLLRISLDGYRLTYEFQGTADQVTPLNPCNHNYYALAPGHTIWDQQMRIAADHVTEVDAALIPTGQLAPVAGTKHDFRDMARIDAIDTGRSGLDVNFALTGAPGPALELLAPNGMQMRLWTDQPGVQVYTGHGLTAEGSALPGLAHGPAMGIAIEAQGFPDAVNHPTFPSVIHGPDRPYRQVTTVEIKPA